MKKIIYLLLIATLMNISVDCADASLITNKNYRITQNKEIKQSEKQIKDLIKVHNTYANKHDMNGLQSLYSENFTNNDGFNKTTYFKSVGETWESCKDLTYTTKILSITVNGDYASIHVKETATGTIKDSVEKMPIAGEIHSSSTGIYYLTKENNRWLIASETALSDESSLLYGDARYMNIEIQAPNQVFSGEQYTTTVKVDADKDTVIIGSIDHDVVTYPASTPKSELRAFPSSQTLERYLRANTSNTNEYTVASLAFSKGFGSRIYMSGLACVMRRINVIPVNELIKLEDEKK